MSSPERGPLLQVPAAEELLLDLAGDDEHRRLRGVGIHRAGQRVGRARAGRHENNAEATADASVTVGDVRRAGLLATQVVVDVAVGLESAKHGDERAAGNPEDAVDALDFEQLEQR